MPAWELFREGPKHMCMHKHAQRQLVRSYMPATSQILALLLLLTRIQSKKMLVPLYSIDRHLGLVHSSLLLAHCLGWCSNTHTHTLIHTDLQQAHQTGVTAAAAAAAAAAGPFSYCWPFLSMVFVPRRAQRTEGSQRQAPLR